MLNNLLSVRKPRPEVWRQDARSEEQEKAQHEWQTFVRFLKYLLPHKTKVILGLGLGLVGVPLGQIGIFLWRYQVDEIILNTDPSIEHRVKLFFVIVGIQSVMYIFGHIFAFVGKTLAF